MRGWSYVRMFTVLWAATVLVSLMLGLLLPFPVRVAAAALVAIGAGVVLHPRQRWWVEVPESASRPPLGRMRNVATYALAVAWMLLAVAAGLFVADLSRL